MNSRLNEVTKIQEAARLPVSPLLLDLFPQSENGRARGHRCRSLQGAGEGSRRQARSRRDQLRRLSSPTCRPISATSACLASGRRLKRAQAVEFSKPYLITNVYAVIRKDGPIKKWEDIDKKGIKVAVTLGSLHRALHEDLPEERRSWCRWRRPTHAKAELVAGRVDVDHDGLPDRHEGDGRIRLGQEPMRRRPRNWRSPRTPMRYRRAIRSG